MVNFCQICHLAAQKVKALCPVPKVLVSLVHLKNGDIINVEVKIPAKLVLYIYIKTLLSDFYKCCCSVDLVRFFTFSMHLRSR